MTSFLKISRFFILFSITMIFSCVDDIPSLDDVAVWNCENHEDCEKGYFCAKIFDYSKEKECLPCDKYKDGQICKMLGKDCDFFLENCDEEKVIKCGDFYPNQICNKCEDGKCTKVCTINCKGKECGDNGCGGNCGECINNMECMDGICKCPEIDCKLYEKECGKWKIVCGIITSIEDCGECSGCSHCTESGKCESGCPDDKICYLNQCCTRDCNEKECGDDSCGGYCGSCKAWQDCNGGKCECTYNKCSEYNSNWYYSEYKEENYFNCNEAKCENNDCINVQKEKGTLCTDKCKMCDGESVGNCIPKDTDDDGFIDKNCPDGKDCDDNNKEINPEAIEKCDEIDNDCNGKTDDMWKFFTLDNAYIVGSHTSIAVDADNKVHISYRDDSIYNLKYATNKTGSWVYITLDTKVGIYTSIAVDSDNRVHISYQDDYNFDLKYATNKTGSWVYERIDSEGLVGSYTSIEVDSNNKVHISYYDASNGHLKYAAKESESGLWKLATVDSNDSVGSFSSIVIDSNNIVHISYYNGIFYNLKYVTNASGSWDDETLDTEDDVGSYSSIAIDSNNKVHISYFEAANGDLKYATNTTGLWKYITIDTKYDVGSYSSIALDLNNKVHISYYDKTNGALKYATNVTGTWNFLALDAIFDVGSYTSIAVDSNNNMHISYYDSTNGNLKYANFGCPCSKFYFDDDGDGYYKTGAPSDCMSAPSGKYTGFEKGDCNDINKKINPQSAETCATDYDDDCNAENDNAKDLPKCVKRYYDGDSDGYGIPAYECRCKAEGKYTALVSGDCDDTKKEVNPDAKETCATEYDDNCKNEANDLDAAGCIKRYKDNDGDGYYPVGAASECRCTGVSPFTSIKSGDCDDSDVEINPEAKEICDGKDNDCDGIADKMWNIFTPDTAQDVGLYTSIAVDSNNKVHISYYDNTKKDLKYANNAGESWATTIIDTGEDVGLYSSIAIDSNSKVHISYHDNKTKDLKYATNVSGTWITTLDTAGDVGLYTSLAIDSKNKVHISYFDDSENHLKYINNTSGTWNSIILDTTVDSGLYSSIAIDKTDNDKIYISYHVVAGYLKYATNVSGTWYMDKIDSDGHAGDYTSMAIDMNHKIHISHYEYNKGAMKYTTNASGTWISIPFDSIGSYKGYTSSSIAINSKGSVFIGYYDYKQSLKYASNAYGTWKSVILDSAGNSGKYPSIAIDKNDIIHISYYDIINKHLKYAVSACPSKCLGLLDFDKDGYKDIDCGGDDCNDKDQAVHPGAVDTFGDGKDQNCDGMDGVDADSDGWASVSSGGNDCDDSHAEVHPGLIESWADTNCADKLDNDCDGDPDFADSECGKKIPDTGITKCYNDSVEITCPPEGQDWYGQDAQYQMNPMSYTNNNDGTVTDNVTGLVWMKCSGGQTYSGGTCTGTATEINWTDAETYCANNTMGLPGTGWHAPGLFELRSIVDYGKKYPATDTVFSSTLNYYWTSAEYKSDTTKAWYVRFSEGYSSYNSKSTYASTNIRCVRGAIIAQHEYKDNGDGTITDSATGLMWQKEKLSNSIKWKDALKNCESSTAGGYNDWRVPDIRELMSIVYETKYNPAINDIYFPNSNSWFWSSSVYAPATDNAWLVFFNPGYVYHYYKDDTYYVRCVRSGQ